MQELSGIRWLVVDRTDRTRLVVVERIDHIQQLELVVVNTVGIDRSLVGFGCTAAVELAAVDRTAAVCTVVVDRVDRTLEVADAVVAEHKQHCNSQRYHYAFLFGDSF